MPVANSPEGGSGGHMYYSSNVSLASDKARDLLRDSLKAMNIIEKPTDIKDVQQPFLQPDSQPVQDRWTWPLLVTGFVATFGCCIPVGFNIGVLNTPADLIKEFCRDSILINYGVHLTKMQLEIIWSTVVSSFLIGGMVGSLSGGWLADLRGRRGAVIIAKLLTLLAAILFVASKPSHLVALLLLGRLIAGLAGGLATSVVPMYLTELSPVALRGAMGVLCPIGLTIGVLIGQIAGLAEVMGTADLWHWLLALNAIPVIVCAFLIPILAESPKYLFARGETERAIRELSKVRQQPESEIHHETVLWEEEASAKGREGPELGLWSLITSPEHRLPLLLVCALQAGQQLSGINAVFYYSVSIFKSAGLSHKHAQFGTILAGCVNLGVALLGPKLLTRYGRRFLGLFSCATAVLFLVLLTLAIQFMDIISWMPYASVIITLLYIFFYGLGLGPIPYFIGSELFCVAPRPMAMALGSMANWSGNFLVGMTFPSIKAGIGHFSFLLFALSTSLVFFLLKLYLPETKGRLPKDLADILSHGFSTKLLPEHKVAPPSPIIANLGVNDIHMDTFASA